MSADWYYIKSGFFVRQKRIGPLSEVELMKLIEKGEVKPDTLLCSTTKTRGHWLPMRDIKPAMKHWKKHHPDAA